MYMVVVGGGLIGVEFVGELQDFFEEDIKKLVFEISDCFCVMLIEVFFNVFFSFFKQFIEYIESIFKEEKINIYIKIMVKKVIDKMVEVVVICFDGIKEMIVFFYGFFVWVIGNVVCFVVQDFMQCIFV